MSGSVSVTGPPSRIWRRNGDDASTAADHVAEPHDGARKTAIAAHGEHGQFSRCFVAPITEQGLTALSVEMHESMTPVLRRRRREPPRGEQVRLQRLDRMVLEDGHMLVRGGVKHDVGAVVVERAVDAIAVRDVGEHELGFGQLCRRLAQERVVLGRAR